MPDGVAYRATERAGLTAHLYDTNWLRRVAVELHATEAELRRGLDCHLRLSLCYALGSW